MDEYEVQRAIDSAVRTAVDNLRYDLEHKIESVESEVRRVSNRLDEVNSSLSSQISNMEHPF